MKKKEMLLNLIMLIMFLSLSGCEASSGHVIGTVIGIVLVFVACSMFGLLGFVVFIVGAFLMVKDGSCKAVFRDPETRHREYMEKRYKDVSSDPHYKYLRHN